MTPLERLRADVAYWRTEALRAREALAIVEGILPSLEAQLARVEGVAVDATPSTASVIETSAPAIEPTAKLPGFDKESIPRFTGQATDQVKQALEWKADQNSDELVKTLAQFGRAFGRGAVNFALRNLRERGEIEESAKVGNYIYYRIKRNSGE